MGLLEQGVLSDSLIQSANLKAQDLRTYDGSIL